MYIIHYFHNRYKFLLLRCSMFLLIIRTRLPVLIFRASIPLLPTFLLYTVSCGFQVHTKISVRPFQVTNVGGRTIELHIVVAPLPLDPSRSRPFAYTPRGLVRRTTDISAVW